MKTTITDAGITALINAGLTGPLLKVNRVKIGSAIIEADPTITDIVDPVWDSGTNPKCMEYQIIDEKSFMWKILLDESIGDFMIGNIGLYLDDGTLFAITTLASQREKLCNNPPQVGNRETFAIPIILSGVSGLIDVSVSIPDESSVPSLQTENDLPPVVSSAYSVYEIINHTSLKTTVLALRTPEGWMYVKPSSSTEDISFDKGMFEDGVEPGDLVYFDKISKLFRWADGTDVNKGYLGIVTNRYSIITSGAYVNESWTLLAGADYYAGGGVSAGALTSNPNSCYVGRAISEHVMLLGSMDETIINKTNVLIEGRNSTNLYPSEKAVYDYVMSVEQRINQTTDSKIAVVNGRVDKLDAKVDLLDERVTEIAEEVVGKDFMIFGGDATDD